MIADIIWKILKKGDIEMKRIICLTSIFMLASLAAFADIARPEKSPKPVEKPKKSITAFMSIRLDRDAKEIGRASCRERV